MLFLLYKIISFWQMITMDKKFLSLTGLSNFVNKLNDNFAKITDIPVKCSDLENDSGYISNDNIVTVDELKSYLNIP